MDRQPFSWEIFDNNISKAIGRADKLRPSVLLEPKNIVTEQKVADYTGHLLAVIDELLGDNPAAEL